MYGDVYEETTLHFQKNHLEDLEITVPNVHRGYRIVPVSPIRVKTLMIMKHWVVYKKKKKKNLASVGRNNSSHTEHCFHPS